jgi:hypothetical protein
VPQLQYGPAFLKKWLDRLPMPLSAQDRRAGYEYRLSIWQMEFSLTQIVDRPMAGRQFFEEVIRDALDLGRPDRIQLIGLEQYSASQMSYDLRRLLD